MTDRAGRRGPTPRLTRPMIAAAAIAIADAEGLDAVTVRRVSSALETGGGALYRYFSSRDQLLDLMVDAVISDLPATPPRQDDPIAALVAIGGELLDLYRGHPWLTDVRQAVSAPGPGVLDHFERCLTALAPSSASQAAKMEAIALVTGLVTLFSRQASNGTRVQFPPSDATIRRRWPQLASVLSSQPTHAQPGRVLFERVLTGMVAALLA